MSVASVAPGTPSLDYLGTSGAAAYSYNHSTPFLQASSRMAAGLVPFGSMASFSLPTSCT